MPVTVEDPNVISEERWRTWKENGQRQERASARTFRMAVTAIASLAAVAGAIYLMVGR